MALYEELRQIDVLSPIIERFQSGEFWLDEGDWKIHYKTGMLRRSPWYMTRWAKDRNCVVGTFYFNVYGFIRRECRLCWKVNCKMETLRQLMKMVKLQERMDLPSKCGYEEEAGRWPSRKGGLYSGFWYGTIGEGLEGALKLKEVVEPELMEVFGRGVVAKVKRGCTEMERAFQDVSDSTGWNKMAKERGWSNLEDLLDSVFTHPGKDFLSEERLKWEHTVIRVHKFLEWIHFAARNGDMTYLDFVDKPFTKDLRVYGKEDVGRGTDNYGSENAKERGESTVPGSKIITDF